MKPLPAALVTGAPLLAAVAAWSPLWLAAATVGAALLLAAAPPPRRIYAVTAVSSGVILFVINPFVSVQGLTVLWQGPHIPILDTQITAEELAYGAGAGHAGRRVGAGRGRLRAPGGRRSAAARRRPGGARGRP